MKKKQVVMTIIVISSEDKIKRTFKVAAPPLNII